ncbi:MAG: hypothetical protein R3E96_13830 [Planctomycetota bacterium]
MDLAPDALKVEPGWGEALREKILDLGDRLPSAFSRLVGSLPNRPIGPRALGRALKVNAVTTSRLLKAIDCGDAIQAIHDLPGPVPLRGVIERCIAAGVSPELCAAAAALVDEFELLIKEEAGDRGTLTAILTDWIPGRRADFELQRRQAIYRGFRELNGLSIDLSVEAFFLHPAAQGEGLDLVLVSATLGMERIRPSAPFYQSWMQIDPGPEVRESRKLTELELIDPVGLARFCTSSPADSSRSHSGEGSTRYAIHPSGFGPNSKGDLISADLARNEFLGRVPGGTPPPQFFAIPVAAVRRHVMDVHVHRDVFAGCDPSIGLYETIGKGAATFGAEDRKEDWREPIESLQHLGYGHHAKEILGFPRYADLREHGAAAWIGPRATSGPIAGTWRTRAPGSRW